MSADPVSQTPRTDGWADIALNFHSSIEVVSAEYARTLEREHAALTAKLERAERELTTNKEGVIEIFRKLEGGTLHVIYCNGNHTKRVGTAGMICNCTLGQEIKQLRCRAEKAEAALKPAADGAAEGVGKA